MRLGDVLLRAIGGLSLDVLVGGFSLGVLDLDLSFCLLLLPFLLSSSRLCAMRLGESLILLIVGDLCGFFASSV